MTHIGTAEDSAASEVEPISTARSPYGWFTTLWPLAVIFHLAGNDFALTSLSRVGITQLPFLISAIVMLVRPSRHIALVLAGSHLLVVAAKMPVVGNHEILLLLIHLTVILAVLTTGKDWVQTAVPPLRWVLLIAYSAIAFSKLNDDFVDRAVSCAVIFGDEFGDWVNVSVSNSAVLSTMVIAITLIVELSIPALLMTPRLRRAGIIVGIVFHTLLALEPSGHVFDFTSVLFVLFLLFLDPRSSSRLDTAILSARDRVGTGRALTIIAVIAVGNLFASRVAFQGNSIPRWLFDYPIWLLYAAFLFKAVWSAQRTTTGSPSTSTSNPARPTLAFRIAPVMAVVVLLTSLNAVAPYFEVRTAGAFNMYSNLAVNDGETNHFLLPGTLPLRDTPNLYSYEPVADDPIGLDPYDEGGFVIPQANLAQWANEFPDLDVQVMLTNNTDGPVVMSLQQVAARSNPADSLVERILYIRAIDIEGPTDCRRYWNAAH